MFRGSCFISYRRVGLTNKIPLIIRDIQSPSIIVSLTEARSLRCMRNLFSPSITQESSSCSRENSLRLRLDRELTVLFLRLQSTFTTTQTSLRRAILPNSTTDWLRFSSNANDHKSKKLAGTMSKMLQRYAATNPSSRRIVGPHNTWTLRCCQYNVNSKTNSNSV